MKIISIALAFLLAVGLLFKANIALAFEPIPKTSGFSGFVSLGGTVNDVESNMIAGTDLGDVANEKISSLTDSPDSKTSGTPLFNFELKYTFADARIQLFAGNRLESLLRYDLTTQAGARYNLGDPGIISASFVFSAIPTEVWQDPYVVNVNRSKTDRDSRGVRFTWDEILGSGFGIKYTFRDIDLDIERSGTFLGLSSVEASLLNRKGDRHEVEALYRYEISEKHRLVPAFIYTKADLDGDAMAHDEFLFQLTYGYDSRKISLVVNGVIGFADYDATNPIYNKKRDNDIYGIGATGFYKRPFGRDLFGIKRWSLFLTTAFFKSDANINFYDAQFITGGGGALVRF